MLGYLQAQEIDELLGSQLIGRIGCHADNRTYIVPISYAFDGTYIYCRSDDGMKVGMMRKNPQVCFEVDHFQDMANWRSVVAWGVYEELTDEKDRKAALQQLIDRVLPLVSSQMVHLSPQWPFPPNDPNDIKGIVFRIRLQEKTGRYESHAGAKGPALG